MYIRLDQKQRRTKSERVGAWWRRRDDAVPRAQAVAEQNLYGVRTAISICGTSVSGGYKMFCEGRKSRGDRMSSEDLVSRDDRMSCEDRIYPANIGCPIKISCPTKTRFWGVP